MFLPGAGGGGGAFIIIAMLGIQSYVVLWLQ